jgi:hypothetical protein
MFLEDQSSLRNLMFLSVQSNLKNRKFQLVLSSLRNQKARYSQKNRKCRCSQNIQKALSSQNIQTVQNIPRTQKNLEDQSNQRSPMFLFVQSNLKNQKFQLVRYRQDKHLNSNKSKTQSIRKSNFFNN